MGAKYVTCICVSVHMYESLNRLKTNCDSISAEFFLDCLHVTRKDM